MLRLKKVFSKRNKKSQPTSSEASSLSAQQDSLVDGNILFSIDMESLRELREWHKNNKDQRLPAILKGISKTLESPLFKTALDAIPNQPFPAGSIVKGLASVILLGIKIPERKEAAYKFAIQVAEDLSALAEACDSPPGDIMLEQCLDDLTPFCNIANEICQWAVQKLRTRMVLSTEDQLKEFKDKLDSVNTSFLRLSTIRTLRTLGKIDRDVAGLLQIEKRRTQLDSIKAALGSRIAENYLFDEQGKQECHPKTRDEVLDMLDGWLRTRTNEHFWITGIAGVGKTAIAITMIQCLLDRRRVAPDHIPDDYYPKEEAPILAAQYFFNHKYPHSSELSRLFPTLALQLAHVSPIAAYAMGSALRDTPSIVSQFGFKQAELLVLKPLLELAKLESDKNIVVIIDGVDELAPLGGKTQQECYAEVAVILGQVAKSLPDNVRLVVLSRPQTEFLESIPAHIRRIHLDTRDSHHSVRRFFEDQLPKVWKGSLDTVFPSQRQLEVLCTAADGHLGWAKQATIWLADRCRRKSGANIDKDIQELSKLVKGDLNALYNYLLTSLLPSLDIVSEDDRHAYMAGMQTVLGILVVAHEPQTIDTISNLVIVDTQDDFNARQCLMDLSGVYADGTQQVDDNTIVQPHKSFYDFLTSKEAHADFRVDSSAAHQGLATACVYIMQSKDLHFNMGGFDTTTQAETRISRIQGHLRYACTSFMRHVINVHPLEVEIRQWADSEKFFFWLELMLLLGSSENGFSEKLPIEVLTALQRKLEHSPDQNDLKLLIERNIELINNFKSFVQDSGPASIYTTVLPLSPSSIRPTCSLPHITIQSRQDGWSKRSTLFRRCVISPNGDWVAILKKDMLSLLSTATGTPLRREYAVQNHFGCLDFSNDGSTVILGMVVKERKERAAFNILLFDPTSENEKAGLTVFSSTPSPMSTVDRIILSPQGTFVLVFGRDSSRGGPAVFAYQTADGCLLWSQRSLAAGWLSEDHIISQATHHEIHIMNSQNGELIIQYQSSELGHIADLHGIKDLGHLIGAFSVSPSGVAVAHYLLTNYILILKGFERSNIHDKELLQLEFLVVTKEDKFVTSTCFSPDGKLLAVGHTDGSIGLWSCSDPAWTCIAMLYGHSGWVMSLSFHSHGKQLVASSNSQDMSGHMIRIWNISAIVEGTDFKVHVKEGALAVGSWFKYGITLGGWFIGEEDLEPFMFKYPFKLPTGVKPLEWKIEC
ncbi:hypothetical protein C8J56DRAFT_939218 [Mycena floridula]|nr:hypothetical protein C8J56DRAFT_939218 [Mycena floridula]